MLWTIAVILLVLWAVGMFTAYTAGGLVHLLLVIAVIVAVFQVIGGRPCGLTAPQFVIMRKEGWS
jgi:hypothetical protein